MKTNAFWLVVGGMALLGVVLLTQPAAAGVVTNGLIGAHDPVLYDGDGTWEDVKTGDGYDATGEVGHLTHTPKDGSTPASFSGFDGVRMPFDVAPTVLGTGDFTFQLWVNKTVFSGFHSGFVGNSPGFHVWTVRSGDANTPGALRVAISDGTVYQGNDGPDRTPIFDDTWHLLTVTRVGDTTEQWHDTTMVSRNHAIAGPADPHQRVLSS